jgi:hypothetical protein
MYHRNPDTTPLFNKEGNDVGVDAYFMEDFNMRVGARELVPAHYVVNIHANEEYGRWTQFIHIDGNMKALDSLIDFLQEIRARIQNHKAGGIDPHPHIELLESLGYQILPPEGE